MAARLRELEQRHQSILFVCSITDWPWVREAYHERSELGDAEDAAVEEQSFPRGPMSLSHIKTNVPVRAVFAGLALLVLAAPASAAWWNANWGERLKLTFDNSARVETLVDFPVLVTLTPARVDYGKIQLQGEDIRFIDGNTGAVLEYEIETWVDGGTSRIWVKVPQIIGFSQVDHIWLYYDNLAAVYEQTLADEQDVWSNSYRAVWHLRETDIDGGADDIRDSTSFGNHGTTIRDKFERLAEVLGIENPEKNMARIFEDALEVALEKKDPERKRQRRLKREEERSRKVNSRPGKAMDEPKPQEAETGSSKRSRYIVAGGEAGRREDEPRRGAARPRRSRAPASSARAAPPGRERGALYALAPPRFDAVGSPRRLQRPTCTRCGDRLVTYVSHPKREPSS